MLPLLVTFSAPYLRSLPIPSPPLILRLLQFYAIYFSLAVPIFNIRFPFLLPSVLSAPLPVFISARFSSFYSHLRNVFLDNLYILCLTLLACIIDFMNSRNSSVSDTNYGDKSIKSVLSLFFSGKQT